MAEVNVDNVVAGYLKLRDKRAKLSKKFDELDGALKGKMERLEAYLLKLMQDNNATQLGSPHGTAYREIQMRASCGDWPSFWHFIGENQRFDMMEKRVGAKAVQTYYEETGELPPGINIAQEFKVIIRKK